MKTLTKYLYLMLLFTSILFSFTDCKSIRVNSSNVLARTFGENFTKFYDRFHKDSVFQMSRIKFPLSGMSADGSGEKNWDKKNWRVMRVKIYDVDTAQFKVYFKKTEKVFIQKVWIANSGFSSECRFELIDRRWYLMYVLDQNF